MDTFLVRKPKRLGKLTLGLDASTLDQSLSDTTTKRLVAVPLHELVDERDPTLFDSVCLKITSKSAVERLRTAKPCSLSVVRHREQSSSSLDFPALAAPTTVNGRGFRTHCQITIAKGARSNHGTGWCSKSKSLRAVS